VAILMESVARRDIPLTLLWYPRLVQDPRYLYEKLRFLLGDTPFDDFARIHSNVVRPDWVHQFSATDR
jgi:hypothetical protein